MLIIGNSTLGGHHPRYVGLHRPHPKDLTSKRIHHNNKVM